MSPQNNGNNGMRNKITKPSKEETISVLLVGTSYPSNGYDWRGRFIYDMVQALSCHHKISLRTWLPPGGIPLQVTDVTSPKESFFLKKMMQAGGIAHILRSKFFFGMTCWVLKLLQHLRAVYLRESQVDVIHVNWLQNIVPLWGNNTPTLITVLGTDLKLLNLPGMTSLLRTVLKQRQVIIAPNAHWMKKSLSKHFGDVARVHPIPFGVQSRWFDINRKFSSRGDKQWLTVSRLTTNKIGPLFEWGQCLFDKNDRLCLLGPNQENLHLPEWVEYNGATYPEELAERWFPTAAGLITLSRHDEGRPQVIIEAMAAGLPVIASDLAAHRDVIIHKKTGWIVSSARDLKEAIKFMSIPENNLRMGAEAKQWIKEHIGTWDDCARRYANAYTELAGKTL